MGIFEYYDDCCCGLAGLQEMVLEIVMILGWRGRAGSTAAQRCCRLLLVISPASAAPFSAAISARVGFAEAALVSLQTAS